MEFPNTPNSTSHLGLSALGVTFADICMIERIVDSEACESIGLREGEMYLLGELLGVILRAVAKFPSLLLI